MHELGIAAEIVGIAESEAARHGATKVTAVNVRVGVLRGVVPEHLVFLFGFAARGTIAEGASLAVEEEPIRVECAACGVSSARAFVFECPSCGRTDVRVDGGDSLLVASLELDV